MKYLFLQKYKKEKVFFVFFLVLGFILNFTSCTLSVKNDHSQNKKKIITNEKFLEEANDRLKRTYEFTDSANRKVLIPKTINRIEPTGSLAELILFTLCPEKISGLSRMPDESRKKYLSEEFANLPAHGNYFGNTMNLESVINSKPNLIIDIGEKKTGIKDDMDLLQKKSGIPTIFIEMNLENTAEVYLKLGDIVGEKKQAEKLSSYTKETLSEAKIIREKIAKKDRLKVYIGGDEGKTATVSGTIHSEIVKLAGGVNVAEIPKTGKGGSAQVSMEQIILWNPDIILFEPASIYHEVKNKVEWKNLSAVKKDNYFEIPNGPYNFIGHPPSVNRLIGLKWLIDILYPKESTYDMIDEIKKFYKLFYHYDLKDIEVMEILENSSFRLGEKSN